MQGESESAGSGGDSQASVPVTSEPVDEPPAGIEQVRRACRSLQTCALCLGWGLAVLGILAGLEPLLAAALAARATTAEWVRALVHAGLLILGFGLAGVWAAALTRFGALAILEYLARVADVAGETVRLGSQGVRLLERIALTLSREAAHDSPREARARWAGLVEEIERAIGGTQYVHAQALLNELAARNPNDSELARLRQELATARHHASRQQLAELEAAREVNDPQRVLEIYQAVAPLLDDTSRAPLDRELGRWFLSLIHRRLRSGKIQTDVVLLAARVAEIFASTVEGASLRASLPTLRRSVGLCPRCAQPYTGLGEACPKCVTGLATPAPGSDSGVQPVSDD